MHRLAPLLSPSLDPHPEGAPTAGGPRPALPPAPSLLCALFLHKHTVQVALVLCLQRSRVPTPRSSCRFLPPRVPAGLQTGQSRLSSSRAPENLPPPPTHPLSPLYF